MSLEYTVTISGLSNDGRGIARIPSAIGTTGQVVFIANALPGETVRIRITKSHKQYLEGCVETILTSKRLSTICYHWQDCGGCPLQGVPYHDQLSLKTTLLKDAFTHIGALEPLFFETIAPILPSPKVTNYRNKMTFAFGTAANGRIVLGQRQFQSHNVVPIEDCCLITSDVSELVQALQEEVNNSTLAAFEPPQKRLRRGPVQGFWRFATIRKGFLTSETTQKLWLICLTSCAGPKEHSIVRKMGENLLGRFPNLSAVVHEERAPNDAFSTATRRISVLTANQTHEDAAKLALPLLDQSFIFDAGAFFQVNTGAANLMAQTVSNWVKDQPNLPQKLIDLYCGVGAPGLLVSSLFDRCIGFESSKAAVSCARINAKRLGQTSATFHACDCTTSFKPEDNDVFILADPPRSGLGERLCQKIMASKKATLLLISCNPTTLARDLQSLQACYTPLMVQPVDLFPQTAHLETMVLLSRRKK